MGEGTPPELALVKGQMTCTEKETGNLRENSGSMEYKDEMWLVLRLLTARKRKGRKEKVKIQGGKKKIQIKEEAQLNCCTDRLEVQSRVSPYPPAEPTLSTGQGPCLRVHSQSTSCLYLGCTLSLS